MFEAIQRARAPFLAEMHADAQKLRARIPADSIEVVVDFSWDVGTTYKAQGKWLQASQVTIHGCAKAVFNGDVGHFDEIVVCSINKAMLAGMR